MEPLDELRAAMASSWPLDELAPHTYARDHAAFEARSNQRGLIADWLVDRLTSSRTLPRSVLAVGCGDGELDAVVAERLLATDCDGRTLRYVGIEPFEASAKRFHQRMGRANSHRLSFDTVIAPFAKTSLDETFDVVTFVHSMYYVPDVAEAVEAARALLRPGGEVVVLTAPRGELNLLAGLLAPVIEGHRQWFSDDVYDALTYCGLDLGILAAIEATVDLTDASDDVLDFTVQARLTPHLRGLARRYLADVSIVAGRSVVAHPVDAYVVQRGADATRVRRDAQN
jgi:SAM-dependent methyltransferase